MVENSSFDNNVKVTAWTETGTNSQRWRISATGEGTYYIDNAYTGKRLCRQSNSNIVQASGTSDNYQWTLTPVDEAGYENCFYLSNKGSETNVLEITSSTANDDASALRVTTKADPKSDRQIWKLELSADIPNVLTPALRETMMQSWKDKYFEWLTQSNGFWGEAELMEIILDAYEATGKEEYKTMFEEVYAHFTSGSGGWGKPNGTNWMWNEFNDDVAWGVLASVRAYLMFGTTKYLTIAKTNYDNMYKRARYEVDGLYYLLRWKEGQDGTLSCINGPAEVAACYLAIAMESQGQTAMAEEYYEKAKELYLNQRIHLYVPTTGHVYDGFNGSWASPYNQGTFLGAAVMLYNHYGDEMFKKDAEMIISYSKNHFCNDHEIITACGSDEGDYPNFKAILMRYVRRFVTDLGVPEYGTWLQKNAVHAYNNRNSKGISRVAWEVKTGEHKIVVDEDTQEPKETDWNSYGAFAAVSVAMNATIDVNTVYKDAFSTIQAGSFNYISKVFSQNNQVGEEMELINIDKKAYLGYNLVQFKNRLATGINLLVANDDKERTVEVRLGSAWGELLGTVSIPASDGNYFTVNGLLDKPIDGTENIYLVFQGDKNDLKFKSFSFTGDAEALIYPDITNVENGTITSSSEVSDLESLIDDRLSTEALFSLDGNKSIAVQYLTSMPAILSNYSIAFGNNGTDVYPKSWTLEASNDGNTWEVLDSKSNQTAITSMQLTKYSLSNTEAYSRYRIKMTDIQGDADTFRLSEWQLYGSLLSKEDITNDGGTISAQYGTSENCTNLIDDKIDTKYQVKNQSQLWMQYKAASRYNLTSYSISSADTDLASTPKSWNLYGSLNGNDWTLIDKQENQSFGELKSTQIYSCMPESPYQYFKIEISENNGSADTQIAEWQLFGEKYFDHYYQDFTKNGGILSSSADADMADALIDNDANTYYSINASTLPIYIQYKSTVPVQLLGYSITSNGENSLYDPKSWKLKGSTDGITWKDIDIRSGETFELRSLSKTYDKSFSTAYTYFQLEITETNSNELRIAEWQIYGKYINSYDATSNPNGELNAQWDGNYKLNDNGSVQHDERFNKLTDKKDAKYCVDGRKSFWTSYKSARPLRLYAYSLTSANDNPNRDPKSWTLYGSNNNKDWHILDQQENQQFPYRHATQYYTLSNTEKYTYYKLDVKDNQGEKGIQLAEWQLFGEFNEYETDLMKVDGKLSSSHEAENGTSLKALVDDSELTQYYVGLTSLILSRDSLWFKYELPEKEKLLSYSLTSGNDTPNNDPKAWKLQASNDDNNWVDIDVRSDEVFDSRCERRLFNVSVDENYKYYRLYVTSRKANTGKGVQIAEWELFSSPGNNIGDITTEGEDMINIYPNPVVKTLFVEIEEDATLNIYDLNGNMIYMRNLSAGKHEVDMEAYPNGLYLLRLSSVNKAKSTMVIKK